MKTSSKDVFELLTTKLWFTMEIFEVFQIKF